MADQIQQGDVLRLEISPKYATIRTVPKPTEAQDANFPRNLHNAAELFLKCGLVPNAVKLKDATDEMMSLYSSDPDGRRGVRLGRACVCWSCGHVGIPTDYTEEQRDPGPCASCNETDQVNWVRVMSSATGETKNKNGAEDLPWIEVAPMTEEQAKQMEEEKQKDLAARRAAVEENVRKALEERASAEKTQDENAETGV